MWGDGDILVAEDSRLLLELLRDALQAHGLGESVVACRDGAALLEAAAERLSRGQRVALYLLDIVMPGPDGLEVARRVRDLEAQSGARRAPILLYSHRGEDDEVRSAVESCWPARYVQKERGARPDRLAMAVVELLRKTAAGS